MISKNKKNTRSQHFSTTNMSENTVIFFVAPLCLLHYVDAPADYRSTNTHTHGMAIKFQNWLHKNSISSAIYKWQMVVYRRKPSEWTYKISSVWHHTTWTYSIFLCFVFGGMETHLEQWVSIKFCFKKSLRSIHTSDWITAIPSLKEHQRHSRFCEWRPVMATESQSCSEQRFTLNSFKIWQPVISRANLDRSFEPVVAGIWQYFIVLSPFVKRWTHFFPIHSSWAFERTVASCSAASNSCQSTSDGITAIQLLV